MDSYPQGFPFGIMDVAELLHLKVRRRQTDSAYVDCPFCGDRRGKMNINFTKDVWRCNYCGESGGMLSLYARLCNTTNSDAYREICDALQAGDTTWGYDDTEKKELCGETVAEAASAIIGQSGSRQPGVPQAERAGAQEIHQTYSLLLGLLSLTPAHRAHLRSEKRGLTDGQIDSFGFKSTPPFFLCRSLTERLLKQGCTVEGVPGFYLHEKGYWTMKFSSRAAGILIPVMGIDGLVKGMQILLDTPFKDKDDPPEKAGTKYIWLSSAGKNMGTTSGSPVHFAGSPFSRTIYVTEGALKADIAHCLTDRSFMAVAGANNVQQLEPLFTMLAQNGTELVIEAHDMDKYSNEMIAKGSSKIFQMARQHGMDCRRLTWNPNYKGIDDWQLALRKEKAEKEKIQKEGAVQNGGKRFKERYLCGQCGIDSLERELEHRDMETGDGSESAEFLGLTEQEYAVFCREGEASLKNVLDAKRKSWRLRIYQIDLEGGKTIPFAFKGIRELYKAGHEQPPAACYRLEWDSEFLCPVEWKDRKALERISEDFRSGIPEGYRGRPLASSDVVELTDETGRRYFYVDGGMFEPVRFSPFLAKPIRE